MSIFTNFIKSLPTPKSLKKKNSPKKKNGYFMNFDTPPLGFNEKF
jgi:hypothetical protein